MKNQFLLLFGFIMLSLSANAQIKLGINASYNESLGKAQSVTLGDNLGYQTYDLTYLGQESSSSVGLVLFAENDRMFFMPAMNFRKSTSNFQLMNYFERTAGNVTSSLTTQSLHIPITAGLKVGKFRVGAGPDLTMILDREENLTDYKEFDYNERGFQTGFHFNIGYDPIPQIRLNLGYEMSFSGVATDYRYNGKQLPISTTPKLLSFSIALFI